MPQDILNQNSKGITGDVGAGPLRRGPMEIDNYRKFIWAFNDFSSAAEYTAGGAPWTETDIGTSGGSIALSGSIPGALVIDCGVTTQKGFQTQLTGVTFNSRSGYALTPSTAGPTADGKNITWGFGGRFSVNTASAGHVCLGLTGTDATLQTPATGIPAPTAGALSMFLYSQAGALWALVNRNNAVTTSVALGVSLADGVSVDFGIRTVQLSGYGTSPNAVDPSDGATEFWINGIKRATIVGYCAGTTTIRPSFGAINGAGAIDLSIDYFWQYLPRVAL